ncbi:hypothetical protein B9479_007207 [Cryptococcus floricola]|uniref:F-box domain-containing protein n=1 Tax=Cryptococcus floricola TaxID=2591691 RepID=A0A5D3AN24_9TREE|nr:hypothetical protein B9479_007207 [Cryptococcus floricola]
MSSPSRVAHTTDILHVIFSHISDGKDLTSLLRTSPLFFDLIAQRLYRSLPISNLLNPLSVVCSGGRGRPYGKNNLLDLVQTVVVERAPLPFGQSPWGNGFILRPLPAVETVIIHPADRNARQEGGEDTTLPNSALIELLCPTATRLHISTPWFPPGARCGRSMPSLPDLETLVVKANAREITELNYVVELLCLGENGEQPPWYYVINAVHILLWGDLVYPEATLQRFDWGKDCVDQLAMRELILSTNAHLQELLFHNLCEIAKQLGTLFSIDELWLYNADTMLERLSKWTKGLKVDDMKARVERAFGEERKTFWQTGLEFYEAFGDLSARDETEEWYHSAVLAPSPNLVSLRARLAAKTKFPADSFVALTEREAEQMLAKFSSN